jgi:hypothetical protein
MLEGNFADADFFGIAFGGLQQNVAGGIPPHQALAAYLDLDALAPPTQVPEQELDRLNHLVSTGTASEADRERHAILAGIKIAEYRDAIGAFVDRVHDLQRRIIGKLTTAVTASTGVTSQPPAGMVAESDVQADLGSPVPQAAGNSKRARNKGAASTASGVQPSSHCDRWAIGLNEENGWQLFRRVQQKWHSQRVLAKVKANGRHWTILKGFVDEDGSLTRVQLIKLVAKNFSDEEGVRVYNNSVKTAISRLRTLLQQELELGQEDPIPWDDALNGHRLLISVGYSRKDNQHRPQFHTRQELET